MKPRIYKPKPNGYWVLEVRYTTHLGTQIFTEVHDTWEEALESALDTQTPQEPTC